MIGLSANSYEHIAFDLDGVLVSSDAVVEAGLRRWAIEQRLCPDEVLRKSRSRRDVDLVAEILPGCWAEREADRIASYEIEAMSLLEPVHCAAEFFMALPKSRRSIVTSSARASAIKRLEVAGIPVPDIMITAEDVMKGKPCPDPYLALLARRQIDAKRCLVFEDSVTGVTAAVRAGCDCVGIGVAVRDHPDVICWLPDFGALWDLCRLTRSVPIRQPVEVK